jgi:uncharacterized protein YndB with AHSA1/START domain
MSTNTQNTDRIEKQIVLQATPARVWRALTNSTEFGEWFGCRIDGAFEPEKSVTGQVTCPGYEHMSLELQIERMEPEQLFSYRWHPHAVDPDVDYSGEPTTLVEFRLEAVDAATRLSIVESGFDRIPAARREEAFRMNDGGGTQQAKNLESHVAKQ